MRASGLGLIVVAAVLFPLAPVRANAVPRPPSLIAFTRQNNVYLMTVAGKQVSTVTTRGTGYQGVRYPWYAWSPDNKYLLLVREQVQKSRADLLLMNTSGHLVRVLATSIPAPADFWPAWAIDADQIAFIAASTFDRTTSKFRHRVYRVDIQGQRAFLFSYASPEGCGGGTSDPSEAAYWNEVGYEGNRPAISWSISRSLAAYQSSCAGGVNVTNTRTGATGSDASWDDPALSSRGALAVTLRSNGTPRTGPGRLLLVDPASGTIRARAGVGELPSWTPDGSGLFFVRRRQIRMLRAHDTFGNQVGLTIYQSSLVHAWANGSHQRVLATADAYGFGNLSVLSGAQTVIFSRIDNAWNLWNHRRNGVLPVSTSPTGARYASGVQVQRLDVGKAPFTLAPNAGNPVATE